MFGRRSVVVFIIGTIFGGGCGVGILTWIKRSAPPINSPFQAVLLDTGQAYYGKVDLLGTGYPVLRDVYYVKTATDPQTKQVTSVLVRRGREWHAPDLTVLNARHIVMIEPVGRESKVAQLIAEQEKEK